MAHDGAVRDASPSLPGRSRSADERAWRRQHLRDDHHFAAPGVRQATATAIRTAQRRTSRRVGSAGFFLALRRASGASVRALLLVAQGAHRDPRGAAVHRVQRQHRPPVMVRRFTSPHLLCSLPAQNRWLLSAAVTPSSPAGPLAAGATRARPQVSAGRATRAAGASCKRACKEGATRVHAHGPLQSTASGASPSAASTRCTRRCCPTTGSC